MRAVTLLNILLLLLICGGRAVADLKYISIDSPTLSVGENFDTIGNANDALLPSGWRIGPSADFSGAKERTMLSAGTSGAGVLTSTSNGAIYNFANGENLTSTDRAVGFLNDQDNVQPKNLLLGFHNVSGATITELRFSYDIEKYRTGIRSNDIRLMYGYDSAVWTELPEALQHYDGDATAVVVNPPTTITKSVELTNLAFADQGFFYIRWYYVPSGNNTCQALGIDNFQINIGPAQQPDLVWDGSLGASWDTSAASWKNSGGAHVAWNDNLPNNATFIDGGAGVSTLVNLSSARRAGRLTFNAGAKAYTLSGSSIELTGAAGIGIIALSSASIQSQVQVSSSQSWDVAATLTVSGSLTLDAGLTLTKKGAGNLVLSGVQNHAPNSQLKMIEGTLHLASSLGPGARLTIAGNPNSTDAMVVLDSDQELAELNLSTSGPGVQALDLASPGNAGAFRSLRIYSSDLAAAKANLAALIHQVSGEGIYDSSLSAHPNSAVGLAVLSNFVLIRPTRIGDVNLDGLVTIADFIDLSSNFGHSNVTWQEGDLNGDGLVTIADFIDLAANFGRTYAGDAIAIPQSDQQLLDGFAASHGVPEPASVIALLVASLAARRPRRVQSAK